MTHVLPSKYRTLAASAFFLAALPLGWKAHSASGERLEVDALTIVEDGKSDAFIVLAPQAGRYERQGAHDLARYISLMTGAVLPIVETPKDIEEVLASARPLLILGSEAFKAKPELRAALAGKLKKSPYVRADGVVLRREGKRVYLAGANDESNYFAVAELLRAWGVRWFMPGEFGECVPTKARLNIGDLNVTYSPPFEIRSFWISWLGDQSGREEFLLRNMMTGGEDIPAAGHNLATFTKGFGNTDFDIPLTDPATANHVANAADELYAANKNISLSMEDGIYTSTNQNDRTLMSLRWDKYMQRPSVTDAMLELYNNIARLLHNRHPESTSKL